MNTCISPQHLYYIIGDWATDSFRRDNIKFRFISRLLIEETHRFVLLHYNNFEICVHLQLYAWIMRIQLQKQDGNISVSSEH